MNDIAVYVQSEYANKAYTDENYEKRAWPGMELIKDVIVRGGYEVHYCSSANVTKYKIILVSITAPTDWYSFIYERERWKQGNYTVIAGGAGNMNVRPVLPFADIFIMGRAEDIILPVIECVLSGEKYIHSSVIYSEDFSPENTYTIQQSEECYPHKVTLANGKEWQEVAIGCQRKCLFCAYTWQRKHIGLKQSESGCANSMWVSREYTFFDLEQYQDNDELANFWNSDTILGLDGWSERLRRAANKPITNEMLTRFMSANATYRRKKGLIKLYNIVGYPSEDNSDYEEFIDVITNQVSVGKGEFVYYLVHNTPFAPMPATPAAIWPVSYVDYRKKLQTGKTIYSCDHYSVTISFSTQSLATTTLWLLMLRGTESDIDNVRRISLSKKFTRASSKVKQATLEKYLDIERLFKSYTWDSLPTSYLATYVPNSGLAKLSDRLKYVYTGDR